MKKLIICLIGAIILSNCELKVKEATAQNSPDHGIIRTYDYVVEGMTYRAFLYDNYYGGGISVQNITRDKLQCEILRINIDKAKK